MVSNVLFFYVCTMLFGIQQIHNQNDTIMDITKTQLYKIEIKVLSHMCVIC